ncbi:Hypothetical predicted protein [Olea europaea subsp. europaea]|uniref:Uncharacterized protein n=1 Tax=Olea europaea subsp. europaea TaxID=158383 RepID=A0A8S0V0J3_OLEEU|nr:Hypothetical predicted protein [Olea europaea subsp. europaea]
MEDTVQDLEKKWSQREKALDKQLHSLNEQLAAKQAQVEGLVIEIHLMEIEFERLNARNRIGRSSSEKGFVSFDYTIDPCHKLPFHIASWQFAEVDTT